ncbi:uncharacterized protein FIESC28_04733 [Fusarium coffeatum]|uniref:Multicopper oxidase n=1 Tax=Fusarium coffeatum TaxID=231269 RepID=A0A366RZN8_9HYPO|nr:uncharacterized protein FIESC28_04733 [Fusarium coffeatum]RBR21890.1 hypothetical protein FIESC28_04733 [Fusarium coffeatum]
MVAHVEEAHALLDKFEVDDESKTVEGNTPLRPRYGRSLLPHAKRPFSRRLRACLTTIILILALGLVTILYTTRTTPLTNEEPEQLAYLLHPHEHAARPPTTLVFNWTITSGLRSPDGVEKHVYLVNDQFPGPLIEARSGDSIVVHVKNGLEDEGVSLHWHGLLLKNQNAMDGAVGFTQDPTLPNSSFMYNFTIGDDEHGTFWWHSHSDLQRADGLWGGLVVHSPKEDKSLQDDYLIMVGDWFHRNQSEVLSWYADPSSRGNEPVPDSLLANGRGRFNCSMAVPARPVNCSQVMLDELRPLFKSLSDSMRLRVVNTGSIAGFSVGLEGATLQPVFVDAGFGVQSQAVKTVGTIYPGQRVDFIVRWDSDHTNNHQIVIYMDEEDFGYPNPSLEPVQAFSAFAEDMKEPVRDKGGLAANVTKTQVLDSINLKAARRVTDIPHKAQHTIVLYVKTEKLAHLNYEPVSFVNHTSWKPQTPPHISQNRSSWDDDQLVPLIPIRPQQPTRVDIIINNLDDGAHPFHIHGHSFYVLSSYRNPGRDSWGSYNPHTGEAPPNGLNLEYPVRRDTVSVPRRGHVVLTLVADNPGIWALHCHMLVHMARGMAMALDVRYVDDAAFEHVNDTEVHQRFSFV